MTQFFSLFLSRCFIPNIYAALFTAVLVPLMCLVVVFVVFIHAYQVTPQWKAYDDVFRGRTNAAGMKLETVLIMPERNVSSVNCLPDRLLLFWMSSCALTSSCQEGSNSLSSFPQGPVQINSLVLGRRACSLLTHTIFLIRNWFSAACKTDRQTNILYHRTVPIYNSKVCVCILTLPTNIWGVEWQTDLTS